MSYHSTGNRKAPARGESKKKKGESKANRMDSKPKEKKAGGNSPSRKSKPGVKRLSESQMNRLKEHSKQHKGGMSSPHMKKMMMVMTKEGKSFSEAHKIALRHDKMKKK